MIITVASYKGGVGKTTTAVHLADYFETLAPTLLLDADATRNALSWAARGREGNKLPFRVAPYSQAAALVRNYTHTVIDSGQRPTLDDLKAVAEAGEDELLVIPSVPAPCDTDGLIQTVSALQELKATRYRVLLTRVPNDAAKDVADLRELLAEMGAPVFTAQIPRLKAYERAAGQGTVAKHIHDRNDDRAWAAYVAAGKEITDGRNTE